MTPKRGLVAWAGSGLGFQDTRLGDNKVNGVIHLREVHLWAVSINLQEVSIWRWGGRL